MLVGAFVSSSRIPLVIHQNWYSLNSSSWSSTVQDCIDSWLQAATGVGSPEKPQFAYILWDDDGIDQLVRTYEYGMWDVVQKLPFTIEKADTFRITVGKWFGGIYADVDVKLLQHPSDWVQKGDLMPWNDPWTGQTYELGPQSEYEIPSRAPVEYWEIMSRQLSRQKARQIGVGAIYGVECDARPDTDDYWRMGYSYPLQLTNWAFAMAPQHPTAAEFLVQLESEVRANMTRLADIDPLDLTGPPALTKTVKKHSEDVEGYGFDWNSLTSRTEPPGGRGKVVAGDVLVLPITGFSPGRGWFHNMGSMPISHPNARLAHFAIGSWRKSDIKVQAGKFCRTVLGQCKDWKKIPWEKAQGSSCWLWSRKAI